MYLQCRATHTYRKALGPDMTRDKSITLEDLLYMATNCPKNAWGYVLHRFLYQGNAWLMMWAYTY